MKKLFLTGLITFLPLTLTIIVVIFILNLLTIPFQGIVEEILTRYHLFEHSFLFISKETLLFVSSKLMAVALLLSLILLMGVLGRQVILEAIFSLGNSVIKYIPLVNRIYKGVQDAVSSIFAKESSFSHAVLIPYPHRDAYTLALVVKNQKKSPDDITVFIPGALNPTFGFMLSYKIEDLVYLELSVEDAIKFVVSCGIMFTGFKEQAKP